MNPNLMSIGKMAEINHLSVATLRLYDKMELIKPEYVDEETGYRFYDIRQNARLAMIAYMKDLGMSLAEIKAVLAKEDETETLVFDEVDSGIGGLVSANVGDVILALSKDHQVIAITHSAQIAAKANEHYLVYKKEGSTVNYEEYIKS